MTKKLRGKNLMLTVGLFVILLSVSPSQAQDKPPKKIRWGVTSLSASQWIPWIAQEAKIYEKNGLDVELILLKGSGQSSAAFLGGSIFAAPVALPTVMLAGLSGADLVNIAHTVPGVQSKLVVKPEIQRPEDIKGKRIATSSLGSLGDFLFRYIIRKYGMDPSRDVTWLSMGSPPERLQALSAGGVDAADLSYPTDAQALRMGIESSGMRGKRWSILQCPWLHGARPFKKIVIQ